MCKRIEMEEKNETLKEILADTLVDEMFSIDRDCIRIEKSSVKWSLLDYIQVILSLHRWTIDKIFVNFFSEELVIMCKPKRKP